VESKKGRMSRVYTGSDKKPASPEQVKKGGRATDPAMRKSAPPKTPRMGG
jgi:hypothetical protein